MANEWRINQVNNKIKENKQRRKYKQTKIKELLTCYHLFKRAEKNNLLAMCL